MNCLVCLLEEPSAAEMLKAILPKILPPEGDLEAVERGLGIANLAKKQQEKKYRTPDTLNNAKQELKQLTQQKYQVIAGSRAIAPHLKIDGSNCSHSFNVLLAGIKQLSTGNQINCSV